MTWTKLGDEFGPEAHDLTDAEFRTHVEALGWSNWRLLDLNVPKRDVLRFAESQDAAAAVEGLAAKGWWKDCGDYWHIGLRFAEWQRERSQVEARRVYLAEAKRRSRKHKAGDHSGCLPSAHCRSTVDATVDVTVVPGRDGTGAYAPSRPVDQSQDQDLPGSSRHSGEADVPAGGPIATPSPFPTPGNGNGPKEPLPPDARNLTNGVPHQTSATAPNAREGLCPECGYWVKLRRDGLIGSHRWIGQAWIVDGQLITRCPGRGLTAKATS